MDLFGPLKMSGSGKKYIICITDAFSKFVELVAITEKKQQLQWLLHCSADGYVGMVSN
jgi:hypothetical protein